MLPSHPELLGLQFEGKRFQNSSHGAGVDPFAGSGDGRFDRKNASSGEFVGNLRAQR
jgi:hypothetical protein